MIDESIELIEVGEFTKTNLYLLVNTIHEVTHYVCHIKWQRMSMEEWEQLADFGAGELDDQFDLMPSAHRQLIGKLFLCVRYTKISIEIISAVWI